MSWTETTRHGRRCARYASDATDAEWARIMREIRRRTCVVGSFPDGKSCLKLAAARLRHIAGTQWSTRKHMNMTPLAAEQTRRLTQSAKDL